MTSKMRLHFLTEMVARFAQSLEVQQYMADSRNEPAPSPGETAKIVKAMLERAYDDSKCNNSCKGMYFCDKPHKHKGDHGCIPREDGSMGLSWPQDEYYKECPKCKGGREYPWDDCLECNDGEVERTKPLRSRKKKAAAR